MVTLKRERESDYLRKKWPRSSSFHLAHKRILRCRSSSRPGRQLSLMARVLQETLRGFCDFGGERFLCLSLSPQFPCPLRHPLWYPAHTFPSMAYRWTWKNRRRSNPQVQWRRSGLRLRLVRTAKYTVIIMLTHRGPSPPRTRE